MKSDYTFAMTTSPFATFVFAFGLPLLSLLLFILSSQVVIAQQLPRSNTDFPVANDPSGYLHRAPSRRLPNVTHLRRPATEYKLDAGDTLSVFIDGVLGPQDSNPPVQFPRAGSDLPPSLGYPIVVREKGIIDLPCI